MAKKHVEIDANEFAEFTMQLLFIHDEEIKILTEVLYEMESRSLTLDSTVSKNLAKRVRLLEKERKRLKPPKVLNAPQAKKA